VRCFVALYPDERAAQSLAALTAGLLAEHRRARPLRTEDLHLTLAFVGQLPDERARSLARELPRQPSGVEWTLDRLGSFARARVLWAGGAGSPGLSGLAEQIRTLLARASIPFDPRPFVPHITLARGMAAPFQPMPMTPPVICRFGAVHLVESVTSGSGPRYQPLAT
jgi:2'-5' RNA ligase